MNLENAMYLMGIQYRVSKEELKSIYRKKAIELHPDTNKSANASEKFKELNAAFTFLNNNLNSLKREPPNCPTIYRTFDKDVNQAIAIPLDSLKENDLCLYVMWHGTEYRIVLKKGMVLPTTIKFNTIDLKIYIKEEFTY